MAARRGDTYRGRSRQERAGDRRDRIVAAALQLFGTRDYEAVTVADVCADAKVSKRYFYEHFTDREALLLAVYREQHDWLLAGVGRAAPQRPASLEDVLRPMMRTLVRMLREHPERARVIYADAPRMESRRRGVLREDAEFLGRLIARRIGLSMDPLRYERTLLALSAAISEIVMDWRARDMADDPDLLVEHLTWLATSMLAEH